MPVPSWASVVILLFCGGLMTTLTVLGFDLPTASFFTLVVGWITTEIVKRLGSGGGPPPDPGAL